MKADAAAAEKLRRLGFTTVPVTAVGDRAVYGFDRKALRELVGLSPDPTVPLSSDELLEKYRLIFGAAKRAIMQIPQDKLDWETPGRARTLRQLTWHIFDRADVFASLVDGGEFTEGMIDDYMTRSNMYRTAPDIAGYGEEVLARIEVLLTTRRDALHRPVTAYFGTSTTEELLNRALSMAAFRLKGTYRYLEMLGIEPDAPLGADDFSGIAIPSGNP